MDVSKIPFTLGLHEIAPGVYAYLQPDGGWGLSNAGLIIGKDESFLVDTLFDVEHTRIMLEIMAPITCRNPIVGALNTHDNGIQYPSWVDLGDHVWGNQLLPATTTIYAMTNCCHALSCAPLDGIKKLKTLPSTAFPTPYAEKWFKETFTKRFDHSTVDLRVPDVGLDKSTTVEIGGRKIELLYLGPAHTEGDMVAYLPDAKVLFAGDLLFFKGILLERPSDTRNSPGLGGSVLVMDQYPRSFPRHGY
jgi:glyoxylase-like metal-dependent hydrolase (beta-lactamase superfamily II)